MAGRLQSGPGAAFLGPTCWSFSSLQPEPNQTTDGSVLCSHRFNLDTCIKVVGGTDFEEVTAVLLVPQRGPKHHGGHEINGNRADGPKQGTQLVRSRRDIKMDKTREDKGGKDTEGHDVAWRWTNIKQPRDKKERNILNPVENIWQYLRANWLSNRVFETYEAIIDAACEAWNKLIALPDTISSIGTRAWAHVGRSQ